MPARNRLVIMSGFLLLIATVPLMAQTSARPAVDAATLDKCLQVLQTGLRGDDFWPAMHAAEGLTLAGHGREVITFLTPKLPLEMDDQKRCGLAREIARAGDRSTIRVMEEILAGEKTHGHTHAAESLFKVLEIGDGPAMRRAFAQNANMKLKLMAAGALARSGDGAAMASLRELLATDDPADRGIAAWVLGQIGDRSDIEPLNQQMARCPDASTRASFEHALAIIGDDGGRKALARNLTSEDNLIRTYSATFAGDAGAVETIDRLKAMLEDPFPDARIRAAQSLWVLSGSAIVPFQAKSEVVFKELVPQTCWFHPRVAAIPGFGEKGQPAVVMTIQKHLGTSDHYSGLYFLRTNDLGKTWTKPIEIPELAWQKGENNETIAVCDVTPGWLTQHKKLLAIGIRLRYSPKGEQLLDKHRSHDCAYATYDPATNRWTPWKRLHVPDADNKFFLLSPGCVQWLERSDGTLMIPAYYSQSSKSHYSSTILHCSFDGDELKFQKHLGEFSSPTGRGLYEPSLAEFGGRYFITLRADHAAFVSSSSDGETFGPVKRWEFDDGKDLGSYNTQAHWLSHSSGLFLVYTRRVTEADRLSKNDHIPRHRAPLFIAQVNPQTLQVIKATEQIVLPERGVMLGNFGAAAITSHESWVTDSEYILTGKPHSKGADGTTWLGRVKWSLPNQQLR